MDLVEVTGNMVYNCLSKLNMNHFLYQRWLTLGNNDIT